jgi:putative component of membrane protein insertase Oxa1/YidC/SpoIIIJ protein YidD
MQPDRHVEKYSYARHPHNEVEFVFSSLFLFYKNMISSQDISSCVFHPSCSEYALQAIQRRGIFIGSLMAFDRLSRCNGFSREKYHMNPETMLLDDPVE